MLTLNLRHDGTDPLYRQIYAGLRAQILAGALPAGTQLPSSRALANHYQIARITVVQAYEQLALEGFIEQRHGSGSYVSEGLQLPADRPVSTRPHWARWGQRLETVIAAPEEVEATQRPEFDFGFGRPLRQSFPYDVWRRLLARYLSTDDAILARYGSAAGFLPLREAVADYLVQWRGVRCVPEQVVIVSGSQQALDILARLLLTPGDCVAVEDPGFVDAYELLRMHGARLCGVPTDAQGLISSALPEGERIRLAFVTPSNQFPKGGTLPLKRRLELLNWAARHNAYLIEDDYDGELRYEGRPVAALQGLDGAGRVIYLGSFSKVLFPALRLGYVVLPEPLLERFVQTKALVDRGAPTLTQAAVTDFISEGHFERHLKRLRRAYGARRAVLLAAVAQAMPAGSYKVVTEPAGLHVMLYLQPGLNEALLIRAAAQQGLHFYAGSPYHLNPPPAPSILLGFSGLDEAQIEVGIGRLAQLIEQVRQL
ncbi:MAG: PLP-dependent aminotransferase family protein [Anaerolineales bacterium]|nr:PLP-dependent aminotransferase family protein [Anaerolineales bacterium]